MRRHDLVITHVMSMPVAIAQCHRFLREHLPQAEIRAATSTGHDRTGLVVFQRADEPGSLISILQEFAARRINLSNMISRPIKNGGLGDYCFIILGEGHVADELMAAIRRRVD
jgi:prephenate dehydratase